MTTKFLLANLFVDDNDSDDDVPFDQLIVKWHSKTCTEGVITCLWYLVIVDDVIAVSKMNVDDILASVINIDFSDDRTNVNEVNEIGTLLRDIERFI